MDNFQGPYLEINKNNNQLISNRSFQELRKEIREELIECCHKVMDSNEPKKFVRHIGDSFYDLSILPVSDEHGSINAAVATGFTRTGTKVFPHFEDVVFDNLPIALFFLERVDGEYFIKAANKTFLKASGKSLEEVIGKNIKSMRPSSATSSSYETLLSRYEAAIRDKKVVRWEEKSQLPDGAKYGEVSVVPVFNDDGSCDGLLGMVHNTTEKKNTDIELQKQFKLLNAVVEGTTDAVFIKDLEGRYILVNASTSRFHGIPKEQIIGHTDFELTNGPVAALYSAHDKEVIEKNITKTFLEEGVLGGKYQCFLSLKGPYKDAEGNVIGMIGLSRDITELKASQRALEASKEEIKRYSKRLEMLSNFSESLSKAKLDLRRICGIIVKEATVNFQEGAIIELLNSEEELETQCIHHTSNDVLDEIIELKTKGALNFGELEGKMIVHTGSSPLRVQLSPNHLGIEQVYIVLLKSLERPLGLLKIIGKNQSYSQSDQAFIQTFADRSALAIQNARLYKEANEAIQLREDFIQVASHELRTPLTPLKLQLGLLQRFLSSNVITVSTGGNELLKIIRGADKQVNRLTDLIEDLIDVTKLSTENLTLVFKEEDIIELTKETVNEFNIKYPDSKTIFDSAINDKLIARLDKSRFKQALNKLLLNALQFGLNRPIKVSTRRSNKKIEIRIQDFGLGITKEDQQRIFDRFERGLSINSYGGLGMGLFITKKIIEAHGGTIEVESELSKGSTFSLFVPLI